MTSAAIILILTVVVFALFGVPLVWSLVLASICALSAGRCV